MQPIQIIDFQGSFNSQLANYLQSHTIDSNNYYVIGIIGAQSSGKSTFLNHLIHTHFQTMDEQVQRKQTT